MALIFCDSFSHYTHTGGCTMQAKHPGATGSIVPTANRSGQSAWRNGKLTRGSGDQGEPVTSRPTLTVEFAIKLVSAAAGPRTILTLNNLAGPKLTLVWLPSGQLRVDWPGGGSMTTAWVMSYNVWQHIGLQGTLHPSSGAFDLRTSGVSRLSQSGINTDPDSQPWVWQFVINPDSVATPFQDICDLSVSTDTFVGDCVVKALFANAAGFYTAWSPSSSTALDCVDDTVADGDTSYVSTDVAGNRVSFGFEALGLVGSIRGVQHTSAVRSESGSGSVVKQFTRTGGVDADGPTLFPMNDAFWTMKTHMMPVNPATSGAWNAAAVDALEAGTLLVVS